MIIRLLIFTSKYSVVSFVFIYYSTNQPFGLSNNYFIIILFLPISRYCFIPTMTVHNYYVTQLLDEDYFIVVNHTHIYTYSHDEKLTEKKFLRSVRPS